MTPPSARSASKSKTKTSAKTAKPKTAVKTRPELEPKAATKKKAAVPAGMMSAPVQERSQKTLEKLMQATLKTLEKHGLEGATIPRIAAVAGVAPANVYRRFEDKDALLRTTFLNMLEHSAQVNREQMKPETMHGVPLEKAVSSIVTGMLKQYRQAPGLLRALRRFTDQKTDKSFHKKAITLMTENYSLLVDLMMTYRSQIKHPKPEEAIRFAILQAGTALEVIALEGETMWEHVLPMSDEALCAELSRSMLAYLRA